MATAWPAASSARATSTSCFSAPPRPRSLMTYRILILACELSVHQADGEPQEALLRRRGERAADQARGEEAEQPRRRAFEETAQQRRELGVVAEAAERAPDVRP